MINVINKQSSLGHAILESSVHVARTKCSTFFIFVTIAISPFVSLVYNVINLAIIFFFFWHPDLLVDVLYLTLANISSLVNLLFYKYLKVVCLLLYTNIFRPIMPFIINIVDRVAHSTFNIGMIAVEHVGYEHGMRILVFILILTLFHFFNILIYNSIQLSTQLLHIVFG